MSTTPLPLPQLARWQPLRAGLVDIFYYDRDEFWFRDGRLLLRGNNGTGKSKVLALMLPFLLDADLSPHRVEPDADPKKRMEWNLLLGGAHPNSERLGYTWLEFGRIGEDGIAQYCTIGAGLKAVAGRGMSTPWYFITRQRVGEELSLVDDAGIALTKDRLSEALGARGHRYDRAAGYRRGVDEALFGLGEQRYGALVDLLIQLRQPQLSKRPSEKALSAALTHALPPLDQAILTDVAEAFRSLEEDRQALTDLRESTEATASFLKHYRRYAQLISRRRAIEPRRAQALLDGVSRELAEAEAAHESAERTAAAAKASLDQLSTAREGLQEREIVLRNSAVMDSARELENAATAAHAAAKEAARADDDTDKAESAVARRRAGHDETAVRLAAASERLEGNRARCGDAAAQAGLADAHARDVAAHTEAGDMRRAAEQIADSHARAITELRALLGRATTAQQALSATRRDLDGFDARASELSGRASQAQDKIAAAAAYLVAETRRQITAAQELRLPRPEDVLAELDLWATSTEGPNPAAAHIAAARESAAEALVLAEAAGTAQKRDLDVEAAALIAEARRLEAGNDAAPPTAHTQDLTAWADRPGAPLWRVTEFAESVAETDRAGLEAALEAAGILDAWLDPSGQLHGPAGELLLHPDGLTLASAAGPTLSAALVPAIDHAEPQAAALTDDVVAAALDAIGLGSGSHHHTWVGVDGGFRVGVLTGAWRKDAAAYIGSGAREAARRARLHVVQDRQSVIANELAELADRAIVLAGRRRVLAAETAAMASDVPLRQAHSALATIESDQRRIAETRGVALAQTAAAVQAHETADAAAQQAARDAGLPTDPAELADMGDALGRYRGAVAELGGALRDRVAAEAALDERRAELEEAEGALLLADDRLDEARRLSMGAQERLATLRETVGAEVKELQAKLSQVGLDLEANRVAARAATTAHDGAIEARGTANGLLLQLRGRVQEALSRRVAAAESLRRFAASGLLAVALPDRQFPPTARWTPEEALRLASQIDHDLATMEASDEAITRAQRSVGDEHKGLSDVLGRQGNSTSTQLEDAVILVEITFRGQATTVQDLAAALQSEHTDRERLLTEREREILEDHLLAEVASTMQELIANAEAQVARMNAELDSRPTSTGMRLRLHWQPRDDGPAGLGAAQQTLRQTPHTWSDGDRAAVGAFLQKEIADVRLRNISGTWLEHLTEALDYRAWNRFVIKRHQNGQWRSATGPASGGERVLAASVPLFAAASAHYGSAGNPHAPRLVTLDEAFAGVDDNARAKYLGLLAAFDLDVVMTSEREWGCYPEVPGLAIAQLSRTDDVAAVLVTRWEWDGTLKRLGAVPERPHLTASLTPVDPDQESLWV